MTIESETEYVRSLSCSESPFGDRVQSVDPKVHSTGIEGFDGGTLTTDYYALRIGTEVLAAFGSVLEYFAPDGKHKTNALAWVDRDVYFRGDVAREPAHDRPHRLITRELRCDDSRVNGGISGEDFMRELRAIAKDEQSPSSESNQ